MPLLSDGNWLAWIAVPAVEQTLLLIGVLLLARFAPLPSHYQPWSLLKLLAERIAGKVRKSGDSAAQQQLAGALALFVLLLPVLLLCWALAQLSEWPAAFEAVLLYLCLDFSACRQQVTSAAGFLARGQRQLCKDTLQKLLWRDCQPLSEAGLCKAGIEVLAKRQAYQLFAVVLCFLAGGVLLAVSYRLCFELNQAWNLKSRVNRPFGQLVSSTVRLLSWPALWLYGCWVATLYQFWPALRYYRQTPACAQGRAATFVLAAWSAALRRNLAGPVSVDGQKIRYPRIGPPAQPQLTDLQLAIRLSKQIDNSLLLIFSVTLALLLFYYWPVFADA